MILADRLRGLSWSLLTLAGIGTGLGCGDVPSTSVTPTPPTVLQPKAADEAGDEAAKKENEKDKEKGSSKDAAKPSADPKNEQKPADSQPSAATKPGAVTPVDLTAKAVAEPGDAEAVPDADGVTLTSVTYDEFRSRIASNKKAKLTIVDAWATWCGPCKENFPHVVLMHEKYADQGLAVVSLALDEPKDREKALEFLRKTKAVCTNYLISEEVSTAFEKLDVIAIPAVFLFGPDGKEIRRYTWDDPNRQFTYDEVEKAVVALLKGEPAPKDSGQVKAEAVPEKPKG